jgi:hypothetical protein
MMSVTLRRLALAVTLGLASSGTVGAADLYDKGKAPKGEIALPPPAEVKSLAVHPTTVTLTGSEDACQLILTGTLAGARLQDLSGDVKYEVADPKVARVTASGRVVPVGNGKTIITARYGPRHVCVSVEAESVGDSLPINFANQVVPIFTKLGCNSGGCHGKSGGQNGFALSLLGFVPEMDYAALVKETRGRRLMLAAPEHSLLLLKATGSVAHAGGKRMETDSDEYKIIRRWIASGTPYGSADDPVVTKITVFPEHRMVPRNNRQQFAVYAHYSDDTVQDVTRLAQYESNEQDVAVVDGTGLVRTLDMSGEAAVMARYQGQVAVFRATVPLGMKIPEYQFEPKTVVDRFTHKQWQELGIVPSDLCSDEHFIRRVSLDLTGTLPTPAQVKAFLADPSPDKRDRLVDRLLETPEYSYYFANKWADVLRVRRGRNNINASRAYGTFAFHSWIRESIARDKPYDEFVRGILGAVGDETSSPPVFWYKDLKTPDQFVDDAAQVFLGVRMACANCHHHPYEKWSQDDYWGLAAYFGRLGRKNVPVPGVLQQGQNQRQLLYTKATGVVMNKRTNKAAVLRPLDGSPVKLLAGEDPRHRLVDWMVSADNPFFARAVANRYWAHFFGRGIVDPLDDMRVTNPPSNPELLDALAKELVNSKYSLKHLVKVIVKSRTYQLSALPNEFNKHDKRSYARFYPRRMSAEVLYDAVNQTTGNSKPFAGLPGDRHAPRRAIMLPDESFASYFLDVFGRPQRISACECERVTDANLAQALHLLNSQEVQDKLAGAGNRAAQMAKDPRPDREKVEELFLWALGRRPTQEQMRLALENIALHARTPRLAYENILWALVNTKEFIFIQ